MPSLLFRALAALAVIVAATAATTTPAAALSNYTVTTTDDVVGTDGVFSLREAMDAANSDGDDSSITLGAGLTYNLDICEDKAPVMSMGGQLESPDDDDANLDGDLDHDEEFDLTIVGNGSTINQTCDYDRVLHSLNDQTLVTIDNTTIRNGNGAPEYGDNIRSLGSLTIQNGSSITDGSPFAVGAYAVNVGDGASTPLRVLTIEDSSISGNGESGARVDAGVLVVDGAEIIDNIGSGLVPSFAQVSVIGSTVSGNTGTGINGFDAPMTIDGSEIFENGQGVATSGNTPGVSPVIVTDSAIYGNDRGGLSCSYCVSVTIENSSVSNNGSIDGPLGSFGGVSLFTFTSNDGLTITDSELIGNRSPEHGGAVVAQFVDGGGRPAEPPQVLVDDSDFSGNRSGILSDGGALWVHRASVIVTNGSSFTDNHAKPTDRLWGGDGGAIWVEDAEALTVDNATLTGNRAQGDGGAIHARLVEQVSVDQSLIANNEAVGNSGGGMHLHSVNGTQITDTDVLDNQSQLGGAGLRLAAFDNLAYQVDINGSTIGRNHTSSRTSGGGGVYATGDQLSLGLVNSTVVENEAGGTGAGIAVLGDGDIDLWHVTMAANESTSGQVANLYHQNGDVDSYASFIGIGVGGADCGTFSGVVSSLGHNRAGDNSCGFAHATDDTGVVGAVIGPLADNGGPTLTRKPGKWSPLVNVIPVGDCFQAVDQRDVARPTGAKCDVGAVEVAGHGSGPGDIKPNPPPPTRPDDITTTPSGPVDPGSRSRLSGG